MKVLTYILVFIFVLKLDSISAATIITVANGSSIQVAIDNAIDGDIIKVAAGTFNESLIINQKSIILKGGFSDDFTTQNTEQYITIITSINTNTVALMLTSCTNVTIDGFIIKNGRRGIEMNDILWPIVSDNITISNNIIESNGIETDVNFKGGGLKLIGSNIFIQNNIIRNNNAGRGGGLAISGIDNFILDANIIEDNIGHGDHGGGVTMHGTGLVSNNIISRNRIGESLGYGWGGGVLAYNYDHKVIRFNNNIWTENYSSGSGGAMIIDEGCVAYLENELFYNNICPQGSQLLIDDYNGPESASVVEITNSTFFGESSFQIDGSFVTIKNSIIWDPNLSNNTDTLLRNDNFYVHSGGTLDISYSCFQLPSYLNTGVGNININPLFVDAVGDDFHLKSTYGHWEDFNWIIDNENSHAIDSGDPNDAFNLEPINNGSRINMGCYGNTMQASKSNSTLSVENVNLIKVNLFPNPVKELLTIDIANSVLKNVLIYDELGQKLMESTAKNINVSNLNSGMYFVEISTESGKKIVKKIIKY